MKQLYTLFLLLATQVAFAQSTTLTPGTILPTMTTAQRVALASPTNGTLVFDTGTQSYWYRQSGVWVELPKGGSTANYWQLTGLAGNEIKNTNSGGFWSANPTVVSSAASNTTNPPTAPVEGAGTRLMWIPSRSAFRVGTISEGNAARWSAANIGLFSFAAGAETQASNVYTTAIGAGTQATGERSTAIGIGNLASGYTSAAFGFATTASGSYATTFGYNTRASAYAATSFGYATGATGEYSLVSGYYSESTGNYSLAHGLRSQAFGNASIAIGNYAIAIGHNSTALGVNAITRGNSSLSMGEYTESSGDNSVAIGRNVSTNYQKGAFIFGDSDPLNQGTTSVGFPDQFVARFNNGYYLMTSGDDAPRTGVYIANGQSAWSAISDSTRKEKIVMADGESFLLKLRNLRLGSWNYKNQGAKPERFYGPMAQEIFAAFGKDQYGTIGNDTTVSTLNMDGLLFIFSQALEKRTQDLKQENEQLKERLVTETQELKAIIQKMDARLMNMETLLQEKNQHSQSAKADR
ncbi:tail fiber domain-containing protein [Emticicia agri]|uniref:Peptidase S74 domain-containing protein n=1 Tax=Emticicia agri TaxID=2492393 RepID=A0A4Q5LV57_9BACT|nr:tail fiber domain-containing protein [Emticicia agri]RYU93606.1 hypothetical protein EWM59_20955 [Emticicia agri]